MSRKANVTNRAISMEVSGESNTPLGGIRGDLSADERDLLSELLHAVRTIRYGSIALTMHDGRIVEIHKTERIRRDARREESAEGGDRNQKAMASVPSLSAVRGS